jgi:hypothetical protein
MKKGKEVGTYEFKAVTYRVLPHGRVEVNVEGKATGFQRVLETVNFDPNGGKFSVEGIATTDSGELIHGHADGTAERLNSGKYSTTGALWPSKGPTIMFDGEIDPPNRTWKGRMFEAIE